MLLISNIFDFAIMMGPALSPFSLGAELVPPAFAVEDPLARLVDELLPATWVHSTVSRKSVTCRRCGKCMYPTRRISFAKWGVRQINDFN